MNILLTNDDGVGSEGIQKLAEILRSRGNKVPVIAPDADRSGVSHCISVINGPIKLSVLGEDTWSCSGYPVDCVILALWGALPQRPDIVLSGINRGANLGTDIIYSGTAAAARQASLQGIPAMALSLVGNSDYNWNMASLWIADHLDELLEYWREDTYVNVNIPNSENGPEGIVTSWPAVKNYDDQFTMVNGRKGERWCFLVSGEETTVQEAGSDCDVVSRNYVSVSTVCNYPAVLKGLCPGAPDHAAIAWAGKRDRI